MRKKIEQRIKYLRQNNLISLEFVQEFSPFLREETFIIVNMRRKEIEFLEDLLSTENEAEDGKK